MVINIQNTPTPFKWPPPIFPRVAASRELLVGDKFAVLKL